VKDVLQSSLSVNPGSAGVEDLDVDIVGFSECDDSMRCPVDRDGQRIGTGNTDILQSKLDASRSSGNGSEGGPDRENSRTPVSNDGPPIVKINIIDADAIESQSDGRQSADGSCLSGMDTAEMIVGGASIARTSIVLPPRKRLRNPEELVAAGNQPTEEPPLLQAKELAGVDVTTKPLETENAAASTSTVVVVEKLAPPPSPMPSQSDSPSSSQNFRSVWKKFSAKSTPSVVGGPSGVGGTPGLYRGYTSGGKPLYFQKTMANKDMLSGKPYSLSGGKPSHRMFFHRTSVSRTSPRYPGKPEGGSCAQDGSSSPRVTRSQSGQRKKKDSPKHSSSEAPQPVRKSMRKKTANSKYEMGVAGPGGVKGRKRGSTSPSPPEGDEQAIPAVDDSGKEESPTKLDTSIDLENIDDDKEAKQRAKDKAKKRVKTEMDGESENDSSETVQSVTVGVSSISEGNCFCEIRVN